MKLIWEGPLVVLGPILERLGLEKPLVLNKIQMGMRKLTQKLFESELAIEKVRFRVAQWSEKCTQGRPKWSSGAHKIRAGNWLDSRSVKSHQKGRCHALIQHVKWPEWAAAGTYSLH